MKASNTTGTGIKNKSI